MDKGLRSRDNPVVCIGNSCGGPIWMFDCSGKWFRLKSLRKIISKTISKTLTDQTNNWPIRTYQPSDQGQATHPRAVRLQQSKQVFWERSDGDKAYQGTIDQKQEQVQVPAEVRGLDQGLEVWNRPGAKSQPQRFWWFKRFRRLM